MSNAKIIWDYCKAQGLTDAGAAGLMGNLFAESALNPQNLQNTYNSKLNLTDVQYTQKVDNGSYTNFVKDSAGYGLAQWTYWSRKQNLLNFAKARKASIGNLTIQLDFLFQELQQGYQDVLNLLKTTSSVFEASNAILLKFERPADQSSKVQNLRAGYGQNYYNQFAQTQTSSSKNKFTNSPLVNVKILSPNHYGQRDHEIDTISIHCMAGNMTAESCGNWMAKASTKASSHYGVDSNGRIGQYVDEKNGAWCTSSRSNDMRAITIEVANTVAQHPWPISDKAYQSLILLLVDICKRNNIKQLLWKGDKSLIGQVDKQNMTVHRWFAAKACPGDYLYNLHGQIAAEVNAKLNQQIEEEEEEMTQEQFNQMMNVWIEEQAKLPPEDWSAADRQWAESKGIIKGDGQGRYMYKKPITREEVIALLHRVSK